MKRGQAGRLRYDFVSPASSGLRGAAKMAAVQRSYRTSRLQKRDGCSRDPRSRNPDEGYFLQGMRSRAGGNEFEELGYIPLRFAPRKDQDVA
ncbi:MAG: hypothetical protein U9P12_08565, partial [Verrucomicrobiota bacterium]|nr:hypothetical protein [Verrucomicrobiota bacterium]